MDISGRPWIRAMILVAVAYAVIGVGFGLLASSADTHYVRLWRLAAWGAGAVVAAGQVEYEHFRLGSSPRSTALHAAGAVAANIHSLFAPAQGQRLPLIALVAWPVITAVPAFLAALVLAAVLARLLGGNRGDSGGHSG